MSEKIYLKFEENHIVKAIKQVVIIFMVISCFLLSGCQRDLTAHQQAWIADIEELRGLLKDAAGVTEYVSDEEREKRLDDLILSIQKDNLSDDQIYFAIKELVSDFHIAHIMLYTPKEYRNTDCLYPITGAWFGNDYYILASSDESYVGAVLKEINGIPMEQILIAYDRICSNETKGRLRAWFESHNADGFSQNELFYLGIVECKSDITFTLEQDGMTSEVRIEPVEMYSNHINMDLEPIFNQEILYDMEPFRYYADKENRALCFQYNMCIEQNPMLPNFPKILDCFGELVEEMTVHPEDYDCIVIDLRENFGGSDYPWLSVMEEYGDFLKNQNIKLLIGGNTFSSAQSCIDEILAVCQNVTIYGEETGLAIHNYTNISNHVLGGTGSVITITEHEDFNRNIGLNGEDIESGVFPDVEVFMDYEDYCNGVDTVYQYAVTDGKVE